MEYPPAFDPHQLLERQKDDQNLKLLAIFHFVVGGLAVFGMGFLFLHYLLVSRVLLDPKFSGGAHGPMPPKEIFQFFIIFYIVGGIALLLASVGNILSGIFIQRRKHRIFCMVVAGLNCLQVPIGTVLGVFTIVVLGKDSVRRSYGEG